MQMLHATAAAPTVQQGVVVNPQPQQGYPQQAYPPPPQYPVQQPVDRAARLRELKDLRDQDLITEEEFQAQRQAIIRSI
ncbi:SHOCT domain-containing protein [Kitasatospora cineracea]|uniref:Oligomerization/nucleic acid binding protein n=1 Tax=Kitasatospora cineracea TaxID=88074 RepID=A0A3N4RI63_9ACTN|nr:SHOCT domain-containing protein [Kitasatospora cineracea]RPE33033.1 putative oligomerization/nucleic acid binding protein [Kitasatospora cineracea]